MLQFAIVITRGGLPITSYDFSSGGFDINEVLFSGFISAIQPFLKEIKDDDTKIGEIKNGNVNILYYSSLKVIGVLVGTELGEDVKERLMYVIDDFNSQILQFDDTFYHLEDETIKSAIDRLQENLILSFGKQTIHEYFIPIPLTKLERTGDELFDQFIARINGSRTFKEISDRLNLSWGDILHFTSQLLKNQLITFNVSFNKEQIFQVTPYGMDLMFQRVEVPSELSEIWETEVLPVLSEFNGERSLVQVTSVLSKHVKKVGELRYYSIIQDLFFHRIILPLPISYEIGKFLQDYYLEFVKYIQKKIGKTGMKFLQNRINESGYIRTLLPDFENQRTQSLDKFQALLKDKGDRELVKFVKEFVSPIRATVNDIRKFSGPKSVKKVFDVLLEKLYEPYQNLIDHYLLHEIAFMPADEQHAMA